MRKAVIIGAIVGLMICASDAIATAQRGDVLMVAGQAHSIQVNPLEPLLDTRPELRPESEIISTNLWRGYVATWEIVEDRLFLTDIAALRQKPETEKFDTEFHSVMSEVFPNQCRVLAEWFTGHIVVPRGELLEYVHMGYASTFEGYTIITIVDGVRHEEQNFTARQFRKFRKRQFRQYRQTEQYATAFKELKEEDDTRREIRELLFEVGGARYMSILFDRDQ